MEYFGSVIHGRSFFLFAISESVLFIFGQSQTDIYIYIYISANSCHFKLKRLNWMERVLFCLFIFDSLLEMNTHGVLDCMNE